MSSGSPCGGALVGQGRLVARERVVGLGTQPRGDTFHGVARRLEGVPEPIDQGTTQLLLVHDPILAGRLDLPGSYPQVPDRAVARGQILTGSQASDVSK